MKKIFNSNISENISKYNNNLVLNEKSYERIFTRIDKYIEEKFEKKLEKIYKIFCENNEIPKNLIISFSFKKDFENTFNEIDKISQENELFLDEIYLKLDYFQRNEIENIEFDGKLIIDDFSYNFKFKIIKNEVYLEEINKIKEIAKYNNKNIKFIPIQILDRMYRIKVTYLDERISILDLHYNLDKIIYDFKEYTNLIEFKKIYWNVDDIKLISNNKMIPTEKEIRFEYSFNQKKFILLSLEIQDIIYFYIDGDYLKIISKFNDKKIWRFLKIKKVKENFDLFSNEIDCNNIFVLNEFNIEKLLNKNRVFNGIKFLNISNFEDEYINFIEKKDERRKIYLNVKKNNINEDEFIYDKLYYLKLVLEEIFVNYTFRIRLWK